MIIVADASPLHYLVLIDHANILEQLYGNVIIPQAVFDELTASDTPAKVKAWLSKSPPWLEVRQLAGPADPALSYLGAGEQSPFKWRNSCTLMHLSWTTRKDALKQPGETY